MLAAVCLARAAVGKPRQARMRAVIEEDASDENDRDDGSRVLLAQRLMRQTIARLAWWQAGCSTRVQRCDGDRVALALAC
jgi:hypothetical protein